jgi:hypothetical protein
MPRWLPRLLLQHKQCGPKVLGLIFSKMEDVLGRYIPFFIKNKLQWHIHRLLRGRTFSEKLPKIPLFGPSLILQLRLLGSQQHPQSGVLLTAFSTWGTENSLTETNLENTGGDKGLSHILESKIGKHLRHCVRAHYRATRNNLESRTQLDEPAKCASGGDPLLLYNILHLLSFL